LDSSKVYIALLGLAILFMAPVGVVAYGWLGTRIAGNRGKVPVEKFGLADLLVGGLLIGCLISLSVAGFKAPPQIHDSELVNGAVTDIIAVAFLCSFIHFRGISLRVQFGLRAVRVDKAVAFAVPLLIAAWPVMTCASAVMKINMPKAQQQELVKSFLQASQHTNYRTLALTFFVGLVVAPMAEEFIFRGYIYGVLKRYLGVTLGILLNAALFAAVHVNVLTLPALFIFAVCLTIAYEFTGSILVNMCMHSLFNLTQFCILLYVSHLPPSSWPT
jgi:uncharacterized protein